MRCAFLTFAVCRINVYGTDGPMHVTATWDRSLLKDALANVQATLFASRNSHERHSRFLYTCRSCGEVFVVAE